MLIVFVIFQLCNITDFSLTLKYIFEDAILLELNPLINATGETGLRFNKFIAAYAGLFLWGYGRKKLFHSWKANTALVLCTIVYILLIGWWIFVLSTLKI